MPRQLPSWIVCLLLTVVGAPLVQAQCTGGAWTDVAELRLQRQGAGTARINNLLYIYGGIQFDDPPSPILVADVLDLGTGQSSPIQFTPSGRYYMASAALRNEPYLIGGFYGAYEVSNLAWSYSPSGNSWDRVANLPTRRAQCAGIGHEDRIYVFGGVSAALIPQAHTYVYNPDLDAWSAGADMPTRRSGMAIAEADGFIYLIGGTGTGGEPLAVVERYDPLLNAWTALAPLNFARTGAAAGIINDKLYVCGGHDTAVLGSTEVYDIAGNTWDCRAAMTTPRHSMTAVPLSNRILFVAGATAVGIHPTPLVDAFIPPEFVATRRVSFGSLKTGFGSPPSP